MIIYLFDKNGILIGETIAPKYSGVVCMPKNATKIKPKENQTKWNGSAWETEPIKEPTKPKQTKKAAKK